MWASTARVWAVAAQKRGKGGGGWELHARQERLECLMGGSEGKGVMG